jgi:ParB family chromosome partitioning protein
LAASIKAQGIMQPILVRAIDSTPGAERYEIVAGERRWRAAQLAGLSDVPVLVRSIPDEQALAMALIENIQRENLNPLEEAQGLQRLIDEFGLTHQQAADAVGRSRPAASNLLRLLQLTAAVQDMLMNGQLDMGHARALLPISSGQQVGLAQRIIQKDLSVRETERLVQQILNPPTKAPAQPVDRDLLILQERLSDGLGANVAIRSNKKGAGKLTIEFSSLDQLDGLISRISP